MYESPIDIICSDMQMKLENEVLKAIRNVGINVDKDELIKALSYDRQQYKKGYADAKAEQQWIPVSSGNLPDEGVNVITVVVFREWMEYKLNHIIDKESREWYWNHVVAWMPIEPWKGGESDGT